MSDFGGVEEIEDMLQDFLQEAHDILSVVDNSLVDLEKRADDRRLLNDIFRGFRTIKGGAGFLGADELVKLCQLTENLFDRLRNGQLSLSAELMDSVMGATRCLREMFGDLSRSARPQAAPAALLQSLQAALSEPARPPTPSAETALLSGQLVDAADHGAPRVVPQLAAPLGRRADDKPRNAAAASGRRSDDRNRESTIRVDTVRLDQVLNLSGEIGLTRNRLTSLRADILAGKNDSETLQALDQAVGQLDLLVSDLQGSVMKTRMQPIGRLFQKYPRIARDLARQLGKDVELVLAGEETEVDKTMIEDLADPLVHLIRNAVDHGIESPDERALAGKPAKSVIRLEARQEGDHIVLSIADDGRGINAERIRAKAVEKGLIGEDEANTLDERQSLNLILLPGFSTKAQISDISGRGVGMDVVKTNIQKLSGALEIRSEQGKGTAILISLPLTLAILPVLLVRLGEQPFALPLSLVREILPIDAGNIQEVGGQPTLVVRGEVLPVVSLYHLLGWPEEQQPGHGVLMQSAERSFILAVGSFAGRDDAVIKPLDDFRPRGVAGVTTLSNGQIVLILDMKELLASPGQHAGNRRI